MAYKPFRPKLKKVSRGEQALLDAVYSYLPATGMREGFASGLARVISDEIGEGIKLRLESVVQEPFEKFVSKLARHPLVAVLGMAAKPGKVLCEIDMQIAMLAVERMLGGQANLLPEPRALSDTEQGVMQFLVARILAEVHRCCGESERSHFVIERISSRADDLKGAAQGDSSCAVLAFRVTFGRHAGFVRLIFPEPFVRQALMDIQSPEEARPEEQAWLEDQLRRYSYIRTSLWAEAGRTTVTPEDLAHLEEGDVVLLEGGDLALSSPPATRAPGSEAMRAGGRAILRVGQGIGSGLTAEVSLDSGRARASITGIHKGD